MRFAWTLGSKSLTCCEVTTLTPCFWKVAVPLNLSGLAWSTTASTNFFPVCFSATAIIRSASEGRNCVSTATRPVGPSIQYDAVEKPQGLDVNSVTLTGVARAATGAFGGAQPAVAPKAAVASATRRRPGNRGERAARVIGGRRG